MGNRRTFTNSRISPSPSLQPYRLFSDAEQAYLAERPNRFVMMVRDASGKLLRGYCPNPGKLTEFLIPGQRLLIRRNYQVSRKTDCTVLAVEYRGKAVFLESAKANDVARHVILPHLHPGNAVIHEWQEGSSRFDFLLEGSPHILMEVKSCSLSEHALAMFPDTATERGSRHITELASLAQSKKYRSELLVVISHEDTERFMPNPHTDPEFCINLHEARKHISVQASSVRTSAQGFCSLANLDIPIETEVPARLASSNGGAYLLIIRLDEPFQVPANRIGSPLLSAGWYVYVGSALRNLHQRISRHKRKKKAPHWHIDHLTNRGASVTALPIASFGRLECRLAEELASAAPGAVPGFGCSDCRCSSHAFYFPENPLQQEEVLEILFRYRHQVFLEP